MKWIFLSIMFMLLFVYAIIGRYFEYKEKEAYYKSKGEDKEDK